jgi:hypothetical protein
MNTLANVIVNSWCLHIEERNSSYDDTRSYRLILMKNLLWLLLSESTCVVESQLMIFELELMNSLLQVAACRSLPALQVATRKLHVTLTTKAAEVSFILEKNFWGST